MGGAAPPVLTASRILNASRVAQAEDDTDVTNWAKANEFIVVAQIDEEKGAWPAQYSLQWRDVTDEGSFVDIAETGEIKWGTATDLQNGNAVVIGEKACTNTPAGSDWQDGEEVEGAAVCDSINLADECYCEIHFACNPPDAEAGHEYEFQLYDYTNSAAIGVLLAGITIAAPQVYHEEGKLVTVLAAVLGTDVGWPAGWVYRKKIPITGQSGSGTNYQVKLEVHSGSGSDSNGVVYLGGHCTDFPNDIRFTDNDGTTQLDHWLESFDVDAGKAIFWIEIQDDLGSNQEFYIYYGKSGAASASDGGATFTFFDDFEGSSLDTNKWDVKQGAVDLEDALVGSGALNQNVCPAAVFHSGTYNRTYFGYITANHKLNIQYYDHDANAVSGPVTVATEVDADDHSGPAIVVLSDGKILVFYGHHYGPAYVKRSTYAEDISSWGSAVTVESGTTSYRWPILLSNGDVWLFYRYQISATQRVWCYKVSDDDGDTWGSRVTLIDFGDGYWIYAYVVSSGTAIHVTWWRRPKPADDWENVYYIYTPDGGSTWKTRAGVSKTPPIDASEADLVYDTPEGGKTHVYDIQLDGSGNPYIAFVDDCDSDPADGRIAFYDSGWETHFVCDIAVTGGGVLGGIVIDKSDVMAVYVGTDVSSISEIQKWTSGDGGDTWSKAADVTTGSIHENKRPQVVSSYNSEFKLIWTAERYYTDEDDWDSFLLSDCSDALRGSLELEATSGTIAILEGKTTFDSPKVYVARVCASMRIVENFVFCASRKQLDSNNKAGQWYGETIDPHEARFRTYKAGVSTLTDNIGIGDGLDWHQYQVTWGGLDDAKAYIDGTLKATHSTNVTNETQVAYLVESSNPPGVVLVDWFYVRQYHDPEPSVGTAGEEEFQAQVYDEKGRLVTVKAVLVRTDVQSMVETEKQVVILSVIGETDVQSMIETGKLQTVLSVLAETDAYIMGETGKTVVPLAVVSGTESQIMGETGKSITVLAQLAETDVQSMVEIGKETVILSATVETDVQMMKELGKLVTVLTPVAGTDGLLFMETGKTITILAQVAKTEQYTMGETGKITTVLTQLVAEDQATFRDSKVVPVLALTPATDIQSMIETGKSLTVLTPVSGVDSYIMGETGKQTLVLIGLAESDIQAMKELDKLETVLVVVIGHDVYIPITPPEGGGIWFDDAWGWRRGG